MNRIPRLALPAMLALTTAACSSMKTSTPSVEFALRVTVPSGGEIHRCQFVTMPEGEQFVTAASHSFTPGSHHLLLFRTDLTSVPPGMEGQQDCYEGGGGTIMGHVRGVIYGSQVPQASMSLPDGIGMHVASREVLMLQAHYLNATGAPLDAQVKIDLFTTPDANKIHTRAGVLFYYDPFIDVPPFARARASARCTLPEDVRLFSVFPHYHKRGVGYEAYIDLPGQPPAAQPFYTSTDWEHPAPLKGGPYDLKSGTAIRFYCSYDNSSGAAEYFQGQSAERNEMCMFTGMYYPQMDQESEFCIKGFDKFDMFGTGTTNCYDTTICLLNCPPAAIPSGLTGAQPDVSDCWQKCIVGSCPAASKPLIAELLCVATRCQQACTTTSGGDCYGCALNQCGTQALACLTATCN